MQKSGHRPGYSTDSAACLPLANKSNELLFINRQTRAINAPPNMDISRRQFLIRTSSSLAAGWALTNGILRPDSAAAEEVISPGFVTPVFLMTYSPKVKVSDYRPALNATATTVIFERTISNLTRLYTLDLTNPSATPTLAFPGLLKEASARPDWSWQTGMVAFMNTNKGIYLSTNLPEFTLIPNTSKMSYPTWYPDGAHLAVYNNRHHIPALPIPRTSQIDLTGAVLNPMLANATVWAGFPSVNQTNPNLIVFAGQLVKTGTTYNQNTNYIWLTDNSTNPPTVRTLDPGIPKKPFDPKYQGRASWYSPDGNWIAFESNRSNSNNQYSIYIQKADGSTPAVQVTDPGWNANHAKWYPNGTSLVVTVLQTKGAALNSDRGIASLDVSAFVA
jgi:WD40-like Beta Propeller Repeat